VIVFASSIDAEGRRRAALRLGAEEYCFEFGDLFQHIERVFSPKPGESTR
jgi:hypothetical protein